MVTETHQQTIFQLGGHRREPQPRPGFMTGSSPSSAGDATTSTSARDFLTAPRKMVRVGTWNVRRRGRPRETWRRMTLRKMASGGLRSWGEAAAAAKNRTNWKKLGESVVETLCGTRHSAA